MTTPGRPHGPDDRDPPGWDPYPAEADDDGGAAAWGRAPAGGWGAADGGYDRSEGYAGEPRYGESRYEAPRYDEPRYDEPRYDDSRYDQQRYAEPRYDDRRERSRPEAARRGGARAEPRSGPDRYREPSHDRYDPAWNQGPAVTPRRAARRRRRPPWIPLAAAGIVVVAVLVLGFVVPGWFVTRVLDPAAVQTGVTKILTDDYGLDGLADVRCPDGVQVTTGATFTCDATIDADPVKVPIKITDAKGAYEVGRPT